MVQEIKGTVKVEGTVEVKGSVKVEGPVKVDTTQNVENLLKLAKMESKFVASQCIPRYRNGTIPEEYKRRQTAFYATLNDILRAYRRNTGFIFLEA